MTTHEIPFTRADMLKQLSGGSDELLFDYFRKAVAGQAKSYEVLSGDDSSPAQLFIRMADSPCFFHVPDYLYSAWKDACQKEGSEVGPVLFHGVEIASWSREFIVANLDGLI